MPGATSPVFLFLDGPVQTKTAKNFPDLLTFGDFCDFQTVLIQTRFDTNTDVLSLQTVCQETAWSFAGCVRTGIFLGCSFCGPALL